jgi:hypothetical protein
MRAAWIAARTRNTLRHPMRLAATCGAVFVCALVLLVLAPNDARQAASEIAPLSTRWRDTLTLIRALDSATRRLTSADSVLAARRTLAERRASVAATPVVDTLSPTAVVSRDALTAANAELSRLLDRVENSPLPQSYRALGETQALRDDGRVKALLDSLADVEREREEFGAGGGVDPIFVALTARATEIGRAIQSVAEQRRAGIRDSLARFRPAVVSTPVVIAVDTLGPLQRQEAALAARDAVRDSLDAARRDNTITDQRLREARSRANVAAPPIAILAASLVLGVTVGFALALLIEVARPRVSDLQEAERVTGARALAVVRPRAIPPERTRRKADLRLPPLIDPTSDAYRHLASHASVAGASHSIVTIAGDVPAVTATIAANIGAVSANEMRSTLLIDTDLVKRPITSVMRLPAVDGISPVLKGMSELSTAAIHAPVGRDRWLEVVPTGTESRGPIATREAETLRDAIARSARHYELTLVVAPFERASDVRVGPAVIVCAHVAHSLVSTLRTSVATLRDGGAQIVGIVLWGADAPSLDPPWIFENWFGTDRQAADVASPVADR